MKTFSALLCAGLLCAPAISAAAEKYRIEVMMFAYLDENSAREEHWPLLEERAAQQALEEEAAIAAALLAAENEEADALAEIGLDSDPTTVVDALSATDSQSEQDLESGQEQGKNPAQEQEIAEEETASSPIMVLDTLEFANTVERFAYRSDIEVIWHQAWVEALDTAETAYSHEITGQIEKENFRIDLSGTISLYRSRFIHIQPDLEVNQEIFTIPDDAPVADDITETPEETTPELAVQMGQMNSQPEMTSPVMTESLTQENTPSPAMKVEPEWIPLRAAKIERSRRMRSDEVHYLDHPLLGIVVKVSPWVATPEAEEKASDTPAETTKSGSSSTSSSNGSNQG
ncbi:CsiV family protein [Thalassolituus maritimus]|uniref:Peptidoglycan-binding protein, CsiV n=1 Tax=Thalassolituus maritimus TaxID=484498 RepID=A0ABP9ZZW8_9GAMM